MIGSNVIHSAGWLVVFSAFLVFLCIWFYVVRSICSIISLRCRHSIPAKVIIWAVILAPVVITGVVVASGIGQKLDLRADMPYYLMDGLKLIRGENPYEGQYACAYGPLFPLFMTGLAIIPFGYRAVTYFMLMGFVTTVFAYCLLRGRAGTCGNTFPSCLTLIVVTLMLNPFVVYGGLILSQLDDLLLCISTFVFGVSIALNYEVIASAVLAVAANIKPYVLPLLVLLLASSNSKKSFIRRFCTFITIFAVTHITAYVAWGDQFIYHAYLRHASRIDGFSLANVLRSVFSRGLPSPKVWYVAWGIWLVLLPVIYVFISSCRRSTENKYREPEYLIRVFSVLYLSSFLFLPILYGEYLLAPLGLVLSLIVLDCFRRGFIDKDLLGSVALLSVAARIEWSLVALYHLKGSSSVLYVVPLALFLTSILLMVKSINSLQKPRKRIFIPVVGI